MAVARTSARKSKARKGKQSTGSLRKSGAQPAKTGRREAETVQFPLSTARFEAVMQAAERSGLLSGQSGRIGGRVSPALVEQAKRQTGIETGTDLIEFALATIALEDNFARTFKEFRGKVDPALKLGF
jgi:hypothetical protein